MIIYHGGLEEIKNPKIIRHNVGRDFGSAFYTTDIKEQAERWAKRKAKIYNEKNNEKKVPIVNVYEYNEINKLKTKYYKEPNEDWINMIIKCRKNPSYNHNYDIISGKIANDRVGETIAFVVQGFMRKEDAIERLKFQNINNQIAFCSKESLTKLKFLKSYICR